MSEWGDKLLTEADNARLRAENEKLRVELTDLRLNNCPSCGIKAENDKLRELVRDMYAAFVHGNCYRWCEFKEPCNYIDDGKCQWFDRMVELGTEVVE